MRFVYEQRRYCQIILFLFSIYDCLCCMVEHRINMDIYCNGTSGAHGEGATVLHEECKFAISHAPWMSWIFFKRAKFLEVLPSGRRLALAAHCGARLVLILLLMGRHVFFNGLGKKVSSVPNGNVMDPCGVKLTYTYVLRRRCYFNRRSAFVAQECRWLVIILMGSFSVILWSWYYTFWIFIGYRLRKRRRIDSHWRSLFLGMLDSDGKLDRIT